MDDKSKSVDSRRNVERLTGRGDEYPSRIAASDDPGSTSTFDRGTRSPGVPAGDNARGYAASAGTEENAPARTREIRKEIDQTRKDLSETVNAIQERLNPKNIAADAADGVKHAATETLRNVAESDTVQYARANPVPIAMIGIGLAGLAWLGFSGREASDRQRFSSGRAGRRDWRQGPSSYEEGDASYRATSGSSSESYGRSGTANAYSPGLAYGSASERASGGYGADGSTSRSAEFDRARSSASYSQPSRIERTLQASPLLVGAASMLIGAIVGAAVPETDRENQWMGEARDSMVGGVQQTVRETVSKVQEAAGEAIEKVAGDDKA